MYNYSIDEVFCSMQDGWRAALVFVLIAAGLGKAAARRRAVIRAAGASHRATHRDTIVSNDTRHKTPALNHSYEQLLITSAGTF